jgi:hypothetical protein
MLPNTLGSTVASQQDIIIQKKPSPSPTPLSFLLPPSSIVFTSISPSRLPPSSPAHPFSIPTNPFSDHISIAQTQSKSKISSTPAKPQAPESPPHIDVWNQIHQPIVEAKDLEQLLGGSLAYAYRLGEVKELDRRAIRHLLLIVVETWSSDLRNSSSSSIAPS